MKISDRRRVDGARGYPTIRGGIVSAAGVKQIAAPDDHFIVRPDCLMEVSTSGRISEASGCPGILGAARCWRWSLRPASRDAAYYRENNQRSLFKS